MTGPSGSSGDDEPAALTDDVFEQLWAVPDFKEVVRASVTGREALRYRRMVMEGRVAAAQYEMVRWTKYAVVAAIVTSIVSLVVSVILAVT